jgi:Na+/H+-dicarboxylate symporter
MDLPESVWQYSDYFAQLYRPILFGFGVIPIVLSGMQVVIAASEDRARFERICWRIAIATLVSTMVMAVFLSVAFSIEFLDEKIFALETELRKRTPIRVDGDKDVGMR